MFEMKKYLLLALFVQFFSTTLTAWVIFRFFQGNALGPVFLIGIIGTILTSFIGDLYVFPNLGALWTGIADGVIATLIALFLTFLLEDFQASPSSILLFGLIILIFEYFFHKYLIKDE